MNDSAYRPAVVAWARALRGMGDGRKQCADVDRRAADHPVRQLIERFGLSALEARLLDLCYAVERSYELGRELRDDGGAGLTVEKARWLLGDDAVDSALAPSRALAVHGLLVVGDGGPLLASSPLRIAPGLAARIDGNTAVEELPGVRRIGPLIDGTVWVERHPPSERAAQLAKEELVPAESTVATVDGCSPREAIGLAVALARRLGRGVLAVDGQVVAGLGAPAALLAAARREADLAGHALLIYRAASLGGAWRAACAPPPAVAVRPSLVVFTDEQGGPEALLVDGLRSIALVLYAKVLPAAVVAPTAEPPKVQKDDSYEQIRELASRDADRALGIVRREPARSSPPPPPPAAPAATAPLAPEPPRAALPPAAAEVAAEAAPDPPAVAAAPAAPRRRSRKAIEHFGPAADAASLPVAAPVVAVEPVVLPKPPVAEARYVELAADAPVEEVARVASTSPNPQQRVELIAKLAGCKTASVVASLRANAQSQNPAVRAAAETVMASMFGERWNATRAVPKPVQPPRSDDKDRGPPGGW
ncbi:MAG: hypothetical protein EXR72_11215 [Myxococcales bacterium]|nr:hypothetical protein [Myxococcales bacterium]